MKNIWMPFFSGLFLCAVAFIAFQKIQAEEGDPRAKTLDDLTLSGSKIEIPGIAEMENAIKKRELELNERERRLKQYEEKLAIEESRIKIRIEELEKLQTELKNSREEYQVKDKKVFERMVKTFEAMQPKKSAQVISGMEDDLAVDLLLTMKEKKVALVMELMEPSRAISLNALIAKRKPATESGEVSQ